MSTLITWSCEKTLKFISLLQSLPCLWDITCNDFRNSVRKREALQVLADAFKVNLLEAENKMKSLKTQFRRQHLKILSAERNGEFSKRCVWFGYEPLLFLIEGGHVKGRPVTKEESTEYFEEQDENDQEEEVEDTDLMQHADITVSELDVIDLEHNEEMKRKSLQQPIRFEKMKRQKLDSFSADEGRRNGYINSRDHEDQETKRIMTENADECTIFGQYVACKLRKLNSKQVISVAQNRIINYLFKLEMGDGNIELEI